MHAKYRLAILTTGLLAVLTAGPAFAGNVNKSIKIESGATASGASTVNGSVKVGHDAVVTGDVSTVNGTIRIYENAQVEDVETVNGSLRIADGVRADNVGSVNGSVQVGSDVIIDGEVSVVNGKISLKSGTKVASHVSNVNGEINLEGAEVGGDIETVTGDVLLSEQAVLKGNLTIKKPSRWINSSKNRIPKVIIGPGSRVDGTIFIEQKIELFVSNTAKIGGVSGVMTLDDAVRFEGDWP